MYKNNHEEATSQINTRSTVIETTALLSTLEKACSLLNEFGAELVPEKRRIEELESRLASARLNLAVLGQFKRGKSTLLNALRGEQLFPTAVVLVTAVPTFRLWGAERCAKVIFQDGHIEQCSSGDLQGMSTFLARYITEDGNPKKPSGRVTC